MAVGGSTANGAGNQSNANTGNGGLAGHNNIQANGNTADDVMVGDNNKNQEVGGSAAEASFNGAGPNNVGSGTQVIIPDATVQGIGKQQADDGSINTDNSNNQDGQVNATNLTTSPIQNRDITDSEGIAMEQCPCAECRGLRHQRPGNRHCPGRPG